MATENETTPPSSAKEAATTPRETAILTTETSGTASLMAGSEASSSSARGEVSALVIARMMGLATVTEFKTVESKVDLLTSKLNLLQAKIEKVLSVLSNVPTGADIERVDVQVGALRQLIRETLVDKTIQAADKGTGLETGKRPGSNIQSSTPAPGEEK